MPLAGRSPSANPRNRNAKTYDWTTVEATAYDGPSPELPAKGGRQRWHRETRAWWEAVRRMPHCRLWTDTDWRFAMETAVLVEAFWRDSPSVAAELRLRSAKLGLTHEDRLKLRIRYAAPDDGDQVLTQTPAAVARLDERRKRLVDGAS